MNGETLLDVIPDSALEVDRTQWGGSKAAVRPQGTAPLFWGINQEMTE